MALVKAIENSDGVDITYWKVELDTFKVSKNSDSELCIGEVYFSGYVDKTIRLKNKNPSERTYVGAISEADCSTIILATSPDNKKAAIYAAVKLMPIFAGSTDDI